jgi:hypothetical protein
MEMMPVSEGIKPVPVCNSEERSTPPQRTVERGGKAARANEPGSGRVSPARSQHQPAKTGVSALMSSTRYARAL